MNLHDLGLPRDLERRIEILGLFRAVGHEGTHYTFRCGPLLQVVRRRESKEFGFCVTCHKRPARMGRVHCSSCSRRKEAHQREGGRSKHLDALRKSNAKIRDRLQRIGICTSCRKRPARKDRVSCQVCVDAAEERRLARRGELRRQTGVSAIDAYRAAKGKT